MAYRLRETLCEATGFSNASGVAATAENGTSSWFVIAIASCLRDSRIGDPFITPNIAATGSRQCDEELAEGRNLLPGSRLRGQTRPGGPVSIRVASPLRLEVGGLREET
jgi:hypothetical protein